MTTGSTSEVIAVTRGCVDVWFETRPDGRRMPSWIQRGDCVITDTTPLKGSGQVFIAGLNGAPIDVCFTDTAGATHTVDGAGVVELRFDVHVDRGVEVHVYEPPKLQATI